MNPVRFARLKELALTAAALPDGARSGWLDRECGEDAAIRAEVEALLAHSGDTAGALKSGALEGALAAALESATGGEPGRSLPLPDRIGPYRVLGLLGEGGMGRVYRALQESPVRREVALKVMRGGPESSQAQARFEAERQALAQMEHPGIARLLDAGETEDGRPLFAMELVAGAPITDFARSARLNRRARLLLILEVCRAVRHAHLKGVIHRDLKPSNVLVTLVNDLPVAKVIDFSIARAMSDDAADRRTRTGQIVGTLQYMSPEQARGDVRAVDTRSDVYAIGVLLYELLSDRLPYDLEGRPLHEAVRTIVEQPPAPLRDTTAGGTARVDADLETIVRKCLQKEPDRRYDSAGELADDLERLLEGRPIRARSPSAAYQARKFVQRHRLAVAAVGAILAALLIGIIGTTVGMVRAQRARAEAVEEARTAQEVTRFLTGLFKASDPGEARGNTVTARELLDKGAADVRDHLKEQPRVRARVLESIGVTYSHLGLYPQALPLLEEALAEQRPLGEDEPALPATMASLGWALYSAGRLEEAETLLREAVERSRRLLGRENVDTLDRVNNLAVTLWRLGRYEEAQALYEEALSIEQRTLGEDHVLTLKTTNNLGILHGSRGRTSEATPLFEKTLAARRRLYGETHPLLVTAARNLANTYASMGRMEEALALKQEAAAVSARLYGEENPKALGEKAAVASVLSRMGRFGEAEALLHPVLEKLSAAGRGDHPDTLEVRYLLADVFEQAGRLDEAAASWREVLAAYRRILGPEHPDTQIVVLHLATTEGRRGRFEETAGLLRPALDILQRIMGPAEPHTLGTAGLLGCAEMRLGLRAEGLAHLRGAVEAGMRDPGVLEGEICEPLRRDPEIGPLLDPARPPAAAGS